MKRTAQRQGSFASVRRAASALLLAGSALRCVSVSIDVEDCEIACTASCPPGFECRDGSCVHEGTSPQCAEDGQVTFGPNNDVISDASDRDAGAGAACAPSAGVSLSPCPLPPPCRGVTYSLQLSASGGVGPYSWIAAALPSGISLSADGLLSGTPSEDGILVFSVRDQGAAAPELEHTFSLPLAARDSCWLAYSGKDGETSYLELVDPLLDAASPLAGPGARRRLDVRPGESVQDLAFSPDGRWLAVRLSDATGLGRLALYAAPGWQAVPLPALAPLLPLPPESPELPGSPTPPVARLSWSQDSSLLALVLGAPGATRVGGLRITPGQSGQAPEVVALTELEAPLASQPVWFAGQSLGFFAPFDATDPALRRLYHAELLGGSFSPLIEHDNVFYFEDATAGLRLVPSPAGVFVVSWFDAGASVDFHLAGSDLLVAAHAPGAIVSPEAGFTGSVDAETRRFELRPSPSQVPTLTLEDCGRFLGWARGDGRIACLSDTAGTPGLRIIDFSLDAGAATTSLVEGEYVYSEESSVNRRRAFSPQGNHFAFMTEQRLMVATRGAERWLASAESTPFFDADAALSDLAFSADEHWLAIRRGTGLWLRDLSTAADQTVLIDAELSASSECAEIEGPSSHSWCGDGAARSLDMDWAPDSSALLYRSASPAAAALAVTPGAAAGPVLLRCGPGCIRYAFQP